MSATPMMRNHLRTLPALLATTLVLFAGLAAAGPSVNAAGYATVSVDASASADTSGAQKLVDETRGYADAQAHAALDTAAQTALDAKAQADAEARADVNAAYDAKADAQGGVMANLHAFGGWIKGLFGLAKADADLQKSVEIRDGSVQTHLESTSAVSYKAVAPPQPELGFVGSIQAGIKAMLHLG